MTNLTNATANERPADGQVTKGKTTYDVWVLTVGENTRRAGVLGHYAMRGPRGAMFFVTDHGPKYRLNVVAMGGGAPWQCAPRAVAGFTREMFAPFADVVGAPVTTDEVR